MSNSRTCMIQMLCKSHCLGPELCWVAEESHSVSSFSLPCPKVALSFSSVPSSSFPPPLHYPSLTLYTPSLPLPFPAFLYTKMLFFIRARNAESGKWSQSRKKRRGVEGEGARSEIRDSASFFRNRFTFN